MGTQNPSLEQSGNASTTDVEPEFDATEHCRPHNGKVDKRATWEAMEFRVLDSGNVEVVNTSHEKPEDHVYHVVTDQRGVPKWCLKSEGDGEWSDCPARKFHCEHETPEGEPHEVCKHCWAVANQPAIVAAVRDVKEEN